MSTGAELVDYATMDDSRAGDGTHSFMDPRGNPHNPGILRGLFVMRIGGGALTMTIFDMTIGPPTRAVRRSPAIVSGVGGIKPTTASCLTPA